MSDELIEDLKPLLERMSEWEATMEVLKDKDMMEQIRSSEEDWQKGKTVAWRDVKRNDLYGRNLGTKDQLTTDHLTMD
ncbi:MAG: hypothetical protein ACE5JP_03460 [Candidatus Bipolaricaulia bacterium]